MEAIIQHDALGYYEHHSGTKYTVIAVSNEHATKPGWVVEAIYVDEHHHVWSRPLVDFLKSCTKIGG